MKTDSSLLLLALSVCVELSEKYDDENVWVSPTLSQEGNNDQTHLSRMLILMLNGLSSHRTLSCFCLNLITKMLRYCVGSDTSPILIQRGLQTALKSAQEIIADNHNPLRSCASTSDCMIIISLIMSCLKPVQYWLRHPEASAERIFHTFHDTVGRGSRLNESSTNMRIVYQTVVGPTLEETTHFYDAILMDLPTVREFQQSQPRPDARNFIVALYDCSLELSILSSTDHVTIELETPVNVDVNIDVDATQPSSASIEYTQLRQFAECLQRNHVSLLICQKRVHPYLQRLLRTRKIALVYRVSVRFMAALQTLSGGRIHSAMPVMSGEYSTTTLLESANLGYLHHIHCMHLFGKAYIAAEGFLDQDSDSLGAAATRQERLQDHLLDAFGHLDAAFVLPFVNSVVRRQHSYSTVLLTAPSESVLSAWRAAYERAMQRLGQVATASAGSPGLYVLPGAGMWQAYVARELRRQQQQQQAARLLPVTRVGRQLRGVAEMFAHCLEECALQLGDTARSDAYYEGCVHYGHDRINNFILPERSSDEQISPGTEKEWATFRNPDGDAVEVQRDPATGGAVRSSAKDSTSSLFVSDSAGGGDGGDSFCVGAALVTSGDFRRAPLSFGPVDDCTASYQALQIAVDAVCAFLSADEIVMAGSNSK